MQVIETSVVVIGGGATGVAVLWDLALRGVPAVLVERSDLGTGTSGRWHGLLHSGARYAVLDPESARECIQENRVLRRIAPHATEDTGGLFVLAEGDDPGYAERFLAGCADAGIPVEELAPAEARRREPLLTDRMLAAYAVPDGGLDSWVLLRAMAAGAEGHGARVLTRHPVIALERAGDRVTAVRTRDLAAGEERVIRCEWVVNAAGVWAGEVAALAGIPLHMVADKGVMVVMASRYVRGVVNACRMPSDGDIIVPQHEVAILGTTSAQAPDPDDLSVQPGDVDLLITEAARLVPAIGEGRVLRAFAGNRPLYRPDDSSGGGRAVSRTFTVIDHADRDGVANFLSIVGGKLTTCRLMAEKLTDRLAARMGLDAPCRTAEEPLPAVHREAARAPHRLEAPLARLERAGAYGRLACECELVTTEQVQEAIAGGVTELEDLRRTLRLGFGPCQGAVCAWRAAGLLAEVQAPQGGHGEVAWPGASPLGGLRRFLQERWRGQWPALWGDQARQALLNHAIYRGTFGLDARGEQDEAAALALEQLGVPTPGTAPVAQRKAGG